jgi:ribosomal protein S8
MSEETNGFLLVIYKYSKSSEKVPETTQKLPRNCPENIRTNTKRSIYNQKRISKNNREYYRRWHKISSS